MNKKARRKRRISSGVIVGTHSALRFGMATTNGKTVLLGKIDGMKIDRVAMSDKIEQVYATSTWRDGRGHLKETCFEFTSFQRGEVEVYDYPKSWGGLARFLGYLTAFDAYKLAIVVERSFDGGRTTWPELQIGGARVSHGWPYARSIFGHKSAPRQLDG